MIETSTVAPTTRDERWTVIWHRSDAALGFAALFLGFAVLVGFIFVAIGTDGLAGSMTAAWATFAFEAWLGLFVLALARARGISLRRLGYVRPTRWGLIPIAVVGAYAGVAAYFAAVLLLESFGLDLEFLREGNTIDTEGAEFTVPLWIVLGLSVVVAAPLSEEILFRGLIFRTFIGDALRQRQRLLAFWCSGLAFAIFHVNLSVLVPFTLVGVLFAYVFRESRSLWTPTLAHAIFNGVSFTLTVVGAA